MFQVYSKFVGAAYAAFLAGADEEYPPLLADLETKISKLSMFLIQCKFNLFRLCLLFIYYIMIIVKKTVVYHPLNGCAVLLPIENSKNDRLKVILLVAV